MIQTILPMWLTTAQEVLDSMVWKSRRKDDEIIEKNIQTLTQKSGELETLLIEKDNEAIEKLIQEIFQTMKDTEKAEGIFNDITDIFAKKNDLEKIEEIFYTPGSKDEKMLKIYNIIQAGTLK
jgi:GTP1/Obg family GTP-binding protein